jgi:ribosomal protein L32
MKKLTNKLTKCPTCGSYNFNSEFCEMCGDFPLINLMPTKHNHAKQLARAKAVVLTAIIVFSASLLLIFN